MITTIDWIATRFNRVDFEELTEIEKEIAERLIDEGYLKLESVTDPLSTCVDESHTLYNELVYQP